jgi:hypothetical protein
MNRKLYFRVLFLLLASTTKKHFKLFKIILRRAVKIYRQIEFLFENLGINVRHFNLMQLVTVQ